MNPFEFVTDITYNKSNIMVDDIAEKAYQPFMVNRSLSYFHDCVLMANEMNRLHHASKHMQFSFLINTIRSQKRFSKWMKASKLANLELVKQYYGYSNKKAQQALNVLTKKQVEYIKEKLHKGGKK